MPLLLSHVCELLTALESISKHKPPYALTRKYHKQREAVYRWFSWHKVTIQDPLDVIVALFSALLPSKRTDRIYSIQYARLINLLKRCLALGRDRLTVLDEWKIPGKGDLAQCLERALRPTDDPLTLARCRVTLQEADTALAIVASRSRFSSPNVKRYEFDCELQSSLENIYRRLHSNEAKWLTRMILKDFSCLEVEPNTIYSAFDPRLPIAMRMYDEFEAAVMGLQKLPALQMVDIRQSSLTHQYVNNTHLLLPQVGVKVGPPSWVKAKGGIKHAVSIINAKTMSIERKHDGEYCQIHLDLTKGDDCIQIFSKSGKDSTIDRMGVHSAIKEGLRIGSGDCGFSSKCILEGELLVWSEETAAVLDFHKIRKHVSRSGRFLGTEKDSQPHPWEHLMMIFYDVLFVDDDAVIHQPYEQRRNLLRRLVKKVPGKAEVVWRKMVDFSKPGGPRTLKTLLALAFVQRWEGLVLKPANEPYFGLRDSSNCSHPARWLKLKKDCIVGLGDTADLAVIGAGYDPKAASNNEIPKLSWTHFFIACLKNKEAVLTRSERPSMFVVDCVRDCIKDEDLNMINQHGRFREMKTESEEARKAFHWEFAHVEPSQPRMSAIFKQPFVFEIAGSGFEKPPNCDIFALRFPRVVKIHWDRDWRKSASLNELQTMAMTARTVPNGHAVEEELGEWIEKLDHVDRGINRQMSPWDYIDNEEELGVVKDPVTARALSKPTRKTPITIPPPYIRIDSNEMASSEERRENGKATARQSYNQLSASTTSENSLRSPPVSSPVLAKRKRVAEGLDSTKYDGNPRNPRPPSLEHLTSKSRLPTDNTAVNPKGPLQEVINSSRPALRQFVTATLENQDAPTGGLDLARKSATGFDAFVHRRSGAKWRAITGASSPGRETTGSERTPIATFQRTVLYDTRPSLAAPRIAPAVQLSNPPSPNESKVPDLKNCHIILSSYLNNASPRHLSSLLEKLSVPIISLTQRSSVGYLPSTALELTQDFQVLFLVDPAEATATTASDLHKLAHHLESWHPLPIYVWDWRIADLVYGQDRMIAGRRRQEEDMANELRIAKMSWVPPTVSCGSTVLVQWADGRTTEELMDTFEELERSLK